MDADFGEMTASIEAFKNMTFGVLLAFSLVAIGTGVGGALCGCAPCKKKSCCCAVLYAVPLGLVWLVYLIIGIVVTSVSTQGAESIQSFCDGDVDQAQLQQVSEQIDNVDTVIAGYSSMF